MRNVSASIFYIHRFGSSAYRSNQWRYRGRTDAIQFCVDKRVFIVGFGLYGSSNGSSDYSAKIELKTLSGRILASNVQQFFSDGSSNTFQVILNTTYKVNCNFGSSSTEKSENYSWLNYISSKITNLHFFNFWKKLHSIMHRFK